MNLIEHSLRTHALFAAESVRRESIPPPTKPDDIDDPMLRCGVIELLYAVELEGIMELADPPRV